ncbi:MAG: dihydrofolate reductase [Ignavibacteriales bacterium]|nr:dihydrofolate reductase [Ignavibacteriales bacterium]
MNLILIAALSRNRVIGNAGRVPWDIPEDLQRFKQLTMGHAVLMGRRTYESLGTPLKERRTVVLTSQATSGQALQGIETYSSIPQAIEALSPEEKLFVIGGGEVFRQMLESVDEWKLTHVEREVEGDTFFPPYEHLIGKKFFLTCEEQHEGFTFRDYVRTT